MGWWSPDVLGGDGPLDALASVGDRVGADLYPLDLPRPAARRVRAKLEALGDRLLDDPAFADDGALPVVAAVFLHTGAAMTDRFRAEAVRAIRGDVFGGPGWRDHGLGRAAAMAELARMVEGHSPGKRHAIPHRSLMETVAESIKNGGPIPVNDGPDWRGDLAKGGAARP